MQKKYPIIRDVRGLGLLMGVELICPETDERATEEAERIMYSALEKGLSFKLIMGSILTLTPSLVITEAQMGEALQILDTCLKEISE